MPEIRRMLFEQGYGIVQFEDRFTVVNKSGHDVVRNLTMTGLVRWTLDHCGEVK